VNRSTQLAMFWVVVAIFVIFQIVRVATTLIPTGLGGILQTILLVAIGILHGTLGYRVRDFISFFVITFIISNISENMSILTGIPFGHYYYTSLLGPKLFNVPLTIGPGYFSVGYLSWMLARVLIGAYEYRPRGWTVFFLPLIAAFIMVIWDVTIDPVSSTVQHKWIWLQGGPYFGVPFSNFVPGWYITVFIIFQLFALYLYWFGDRGAEVSRAVVETKTFWYAAAVAYATVSIDTLLIGLLGKNVEVTAKNGATWMTGDIYPSMAMIAIYTMIFVAVLAAVVIAQRGPNKVVQ
jgi:uncharacterized membrane protein